MRQAFRRWRARLAALPAAIMAAWRAWRDDVATRNRFVLGETGVVGVRLRWLREGDIVTIRHGGKETTFMIMRPRALRAVLLGRQWQEPDPEGEAWQAAAQARSLRAQSAVRNPELAERMRSLADGLDEKARLGRARSATVQWQEFVQLLGSERELVPGKVRNESGVFRLGKKARWLKPGDVWAETGGPVTAIVLNDRPVADGDLAGLIAAPVPVRRDADGTAHGDYDKLH
jgi:hypothetical protein